MPSRLKSPKIDKRKQSIQRYQSDSAIVKPRRVISLLSLQHQTTIEELEVADEIALVSIDSEEAKSSTRSQCGMVHLGEHLSDSSLSIPPPPENNLDAPLLPNEGLGGEKSASRKGTRKPRDSMLPMPSRLLSPKMERSKVVPLPSQFQAEWDCSCCKHWLSWSKISIKISMLGTVALEADGIDYLGWGRAITVDSGYSATTAKW